jgi:hypothetical protein
MGATTSRRTACLAAAVLAAAAAGRASAGPAPIPVSDAYYSPRNAERPLRSATSFLILHTTEGPSRGALEKLSQRGEANYLVDESGRIFRVIDQRRVAYHCGRSMWNGRRSIDLCSVGIEVAGRHDREISAAQYASLRALVRQLQNVYRVPDERVLPHSMVAYGAPNQWQSRSHRGRKRCGMRFALTSVRARLGLERKPRCDPDVAAGRLVVADPYLERVLFGGNAREEASAVERYAAVSTDTIGPGRSAWDIARDAYNDADTIYTFPDGTRRRGSDIRNWRAIPAGTRVTVAPGDANPDESPGTIGVDAATPADVAGREALGPQTIYLLRDGRYLRGSDLTAEIVAAMPAGTRVLAGYAVGGPVTSRRRAFDICGPRWQAADTFYLFPDGKVRNGTAVDAGRIPSRTMIFYKD